VKCKPQLKVNTVPATGGTVVDITTGALNCGATCSAAYASDAFITLQANPQPSFTLSGWFGDCTGTSDCIATMNDDKTVTASFQQSSPVSVTFALGADDFVRCQLAANESVHNDNILLLVVAMEP